MENTETKSTDTQDGLVNFLNGMLKEARDNEMIGGSPLGDIANMVDLEIAFTPVCPFPHPNDTPGCPEVAEVHQTGNGYIVTTSRGDRAVSADYLKEMRGRYLLWRGYLMRRLQADTLSYREKEEVLGTFFPQGVFIPGVKL